MTRRRKDSLSGEDEALWAHVARSVTRIELKTRVNKCANRVDEDPPTTKRAPSVALEPASKAKVAVIRDDVAVAAVAARKHGPGTIEPRKVKRVAKGRDGIEGWIDLHGMRQAEAHDALIGFLLRAHQHGQRMVLVITGKGRGEDLDRHAPFDMFQDRDRGVLRRNVPRWLAEPELRAIVVGHTSAHVKHGGDGAFYVQLRNREKFRGSLGP